MFDVHAYLRAELRRYFPDALGINVADIDESWAIAITLPHARDPLSLTMTVGSDDECFRFTSQFGTEYTVPFAPEMS